MSDLVGYERTLRPQMIYQTTCVWRLSEKRINSLIEELSENLQEAEARSRLQESYCVLKKVIEALAYNKGYLEEEDPHTFKELIENLDDVFKYVLESFLIEDHAHISGDDNISYLNKQFYESLARKRRLPPGNFVLQAYPPITLSVRMLRNCQKHERNRPIDHITGKRSFGNVYTISSVIMLSVYAYSEILQAWLDTIRIETSGRS